MPNDMVLDLDRTPYQEFQPNGLHLVLRSKRTGEKLDIHMSRRAALELALAAYDITDTRLGRVVARYLLWRAS